MNQKVKWLFYKLVMHNFLYFFIQLIANAVYFIVFKKAIFTAGGIWLNFLITKNGYAL